MSAQYEKRVLGFDAWLQKQGYPSFCKVVMENGLAKLEIIVDAVTGLPRVFAVEAWIEFCIGMMTGDVEKGGCRELRANTELYAIKRKNTKQGVGEGQGPHLREQDLVRTIRVTGERERGGSASRHGGGMGRVHPHDREGPRDSPLV